MILKQGHKYRAMPHDGKAIRRIYRGGRCYYIASPYSHEATQALNAAFPQYWKAIRDYGWANPALVPFVNEDPMLIVSLVEVGKVRGVYTDGSAYAKTTIVPDSTTKVSTYAKRAATGSYKYIFGSQGSAGKSSYYFLGANNNSWYCEVKGSNMNFGSALQDVRYKIEFSLEKAVIDGTEYSIGATTLGANTIPMAIGKCINANGGNYDNPWIGSIDKEFIIEQGGAVVAHFVPFKRNGDMELLDIVTLTLATRVGTFTEIIEDKP